MMKINLAIIFGGKSLEREVSMVTTLQAWEWFDLEKYNPYLIYLDPNNEAFLCLNPKKGSLRQFIEKTLNSNRKVEFVRKGFKVKKGLFEKKIEIDVAFLSMHGAYGEDGRFQGMLDFFGIPYTDSGVLGSALGMDKVLMKKIFQQMDLTVTPYEWFFSEEFSGKQKEILKRIDKNLKYPLFVKPANAGSSIGVTKAKSKEDLLRAIEKAMVIDSKILVEQGVEGAVDINCSIMGGYDPEVSVCEQPLSEDELLTFKEKYLKGGKTKGMAGLSRIIPAPIPDKIASEIQKTAKSVFREFNCWGVIRMDFLYQKKTGKVFSNEINTIPGSHAYYFWQSMGIRPNELVDKMIKLALDRQKILDKQSFVFKSGILDQK